jgi:hypothetical protein
MEDTEVARAQFSFAEVGSGGGEMCSDSPYAGQCNAPGNRTNFGQHKDIVAGSISWFILRCMGVGLEFIAETGFETNCLWALLVYAIFTVVSSVLLVPLQSLHVSEACPSTIFMKYPTEFYHCLVVWSFVLIVFLAIICGVTAKSGGESSDGLFKTLAGVFCLGFGMSKEKRPVVVALGLCFMIVPGLPLVISFLCIIYKLMAIQTNFAFILGLNLQFTFNIGVSFTTRILVLQVFAFFLWILDTTNMVVAIARKCFTNKGDD